MSNRLAQRAMSGGKRLQWRRLKDRGPRGQGPRDVCSEQKRRRGQARRSGLFFGIVAARGPDRRARGCWSMRRQERGERRGTVWRRR
ncbi:hypothetical protein CCHR01_05838 [Colletotrichum chrysophilum]|uniref:Uncharacterized protein n=1 Tax=Colletotrichum chrysophilum TaxID=1836956 RepID=A0AAD9EL67_9PEZI|nr:hypothetical protein CCHR01_05838 [Colletotrichum chrysophilum]